MSGTHSIAVCGGDHGHRRGLRTVAIIEASKGVLVVLAALGLAEVIHRNIDLEDAAQNLLYFLHVDPDRRLSHALVSALTAMIDCISSRLRVAPVL